MTDEELFENYDRVSSYTRCTEVFKERQKKFAGKYMEDNFANSSSQEILMKSSQTPAVIQNSDFYKSFLSHLNYEERSERLVMRNIRETVKELNKTPEGKKQAKMFLAGVSHPVYGDPGLGLNKTMKFETNQMKAKLLSGEEGTLNVANKSKRKVFPGSVEDIAREHWLENTIPEPAKHTGKAIEDGGETLPKRYQDKTDNECYGQFMESCGKKHEDKGNVQGVGEEKGRRRKRPGRRNCQHLGRSSNRTC